MTEISLYNNLPKVHNEHLQAATAEIKKALIEQEKSSLKIAFIMATVERAALYEEDGFKNAADYGMKVFGWKKSQSYAYLQVGNKFLDENGFTRLPADGEYTISQLTPLLPVPLEDVQEMNEAKEISPEMTVKEIKEAVKKRKQDEESPALEDETEVEESTEIPCMEEDGEENLDEEDEKLVWGVSETLSRLAERISENPEKYPENALQTIEGIIEEYTGFEQACGFTK